MRLLLFTSLALLSSAIGCGNERDVVDDGGMLEGDAGTEDAAADAFVDTSALPDGGPDAEPDAALDAAADTGVAPDASADGSPDADGSIDASTTDAAMMPSCVVVDHVDLTSDASILRGDWALDASGEPVVAFAQRASTDAPIAVARRAAGAWDTVTVPGDVHPILADPTVRVAVDSTGVIHVAFLGYETVGSSTTFGVYYVALDGSTFGTVEHVRDGVIARDLALLIGSDDVPELLFDDVPGAMEASVVSARRGSSAWSMTPTGCTVPNGASLEMSARGSTGGRTIALAVSAVPEGSAPDAILAADASALSSTWACTTVDSAPRNPVSASLAVALATSPDGAGATIAYRSSSDLLFAARDGSGWSAAPASGLTRVPALANRPAGLGFVSLRSSSGSVFVERHAFGTAMPHTPDATLTFADSAYPLFWGADFDDGLHVAYVRPATGGDSELVEALCTGI